MVCTFYHTEEVEHNYHSLTFVLSHRMIRQSSLWTQIPIIQHIPVPRFGPGQDQERGQVSLSTSASPFPWGPWDALPPCSFPPRLPSTVEVLPSPPLHAVHQRIEAERILETKCSKFAEKSVTQRQAAGPGRAEPRAQAPPARARAPAHLSGHCLSLQRQVAAQATRQTNLGDQADRNGTGAQAAAQALD